MNKMIQIYLNIVRISCEFYEKLAKQNGACYNSTKEHLFVL